MGRKIVLTGTTLTDLTAPKLTTIDQIETNGSIFLFDATHPTNSMAAGIPTNGTAVPNILATKGAATIGSAATATWEIGAGYDGTKGRIERSGKGGLHGVVSPTLADSTVYARISLDTSIRAYLIANPTHNYFVSVWGYITKPASVLSGSRQQIQSLIASTTSPNTNYLEQLFYTTSQVIRISTSVGPSLATLSAAGWTGTVPSSAANVIARLGELPTDVTVNSTDAMRRAQGGFILYRVYLEDLTVSGRTATAVDALSQNLFAAAVTTSGGRYYGDTFTDPTTIP